jgi:hypothetical protein
LASRISSPRVPKAASHEFHAEHMIVFLAPLLHPRYDSVLH